MIRAFRDTWELGIHSYLTYLRDRLLLAQRFACTSPDRVSSKSAMKMFTLFEISWMRYLGQRTSFRSSLCEDNRSDRSVSAGHL